MPSSAAPSGTAGVALPWRWVMRGDGVARRPGRVATTIGLAVLAALCLPLALGWLDAPPPAESAPSAPVILLEPGSPEGDVPRDPAGRSTDTGLVAQPLSAAKLAQLKPRLGDAEARLLAIYQLIALGDHRHALAATEALVADHPNYALAQLLRGDLLSLQARPVRRLGDVPDTLALSASRALGTLREESRRRLQALIERPPEGAVPDQFLRLPPGTRHAIAIDTSRSRLYLFENGARAGDELPRLRLVSDFFITVGLHGVDKRVEGDKRTPLGVYHITGSHDPEALPDLYGTGALPLNYPNALDVQRGRTGSGIWLHGTPSVQFVRAPQASDGCVVLANPDLDRLLATVSPRQTPVVIARELVWVAPEAQREAVAAFDTTWRAWLLARERGDTDALKTFHAPRASVARDTAPGPVGEVSLLRWQDTPDGPPTLVVTFEVSTPQGPQTRRQYWSRDNARWLITYEGVIG